MDGINNEINGIQEERNRNNQIMNEIREIVEEIERNLLDNDDDFEDDLLEFNNLQLMSFENHHIVVAPCSCHGWHMRDFCLSIHTNLSSEVFQIVWRSVENDPELCGCYFISSNMASMFSLLNPILMDRHVGISTGVLINVTNLNKLDFIKSICSIADVGAMPCEYARLVISVDENQLFLNCPRWMIEVLVILTNYYNVKMTELELMAD